MLQASVMLGLLEEASKENDPDKRADILRRAERQYHLDVEHQANFVQTRIGHLELDIREQVATSLGATNEMISAVRDLLDKHLAANTAAVEGLRSETQAGFRGTYEQINAFGERLTSVEATVAEHSQAIASFYASRQRSAARHDETQAALAALQEELHTFIEQQEAPGLAPDERHAMTAWLLAFIRREMAREAGDANT